MKNLISPTIILSASRIFKREKEKAAGIRSAVFFIGAAGSGKESVRSLSDGKRSPLPCLCMNAIVERGILLSGIYCLLRRRFRQLPSSFGGPTRLAGSIMRTAIAATSERLIVEVGLNVPLESEPFTIPAR